MTRAVEAVVGAGETLTYDLRRAVGGDPATTTAVADAVAAAVAA